MINVRSAIHLTCFIPDALVPTFIRPFHKDVVYSPCHYKPNLALIPHPPRDNLKPLPLGRKTLPPGFCFDLPHPKSFLIFHAADNTHSSSSSTKKPASSFLYSLPAFHILHSCFSSVDSAPHILGKTSSLWN